MTLSTPKSSLPTYTIRPIVAADVPSYRQLRLMGLEQHPDAFSETAEHFRTISDEELRTKFASSEVRGGFTLGAFKCNQELVGVVSLGRSDGEKSRHRGYLWGMYVSPAARGMGVGRRLTGELIARAENLSELRQVHLSVVTTNHSAVKLYTSMGFTTYGTEPRALMVGSSFYDEFLMVRMLR